MSAFAFYDYLAVGRGRGRLVAPLQRLLRRLLRPAFFRLRDLLHHLFDRQHEQIIATAALSARLSALEDQHQRLSQAHRALLLDHTAAARRVMLLEDLILQGSASTTASVDSPSILSIPKRNHAFRLAS